MKLVSGVSLSSTLADSTSRQLDRLRLLKCFEQICQTVSYAHSQGILHLDIKPANIMIADFGEVLLMDWGQAKWWKPSHYANALLENDSGFQTSQEGFQIPVGSGGTPAYMAPEQACGKVVSPASDIFSLGALLCEILIGRPAYRGSNPKHLLMSAKQGNTTEALTELESSGCDSQLVSIAQQCLAKKPADRPEDAQVVAQVIANYLETALEQAESDRCRFFDLTLDMFCIATLTGYFVRVNANFPRVLGHSEQELLSQPFLNFVHPDDRPDTLEVMKGLLQGKPVIQFCNRYRHHDGHYLIIEWTAQSLPSEGHIFAVARDVTNRPIPNFRY
jgi:serine/threonine-protein kinase